MKIEELMAGVDPSQWVERLKCGRMHCIPDTETYCKEVNPYMHKVNDRTIRPDKVITVTDSEGHRSKKIVYKDRIALALQKKIVDTSVRFLFGNGVEYTFEGEVKDEVKTAFNSALYHAKADSAVARAAREVSSFTEAAELWYLSEEEGNRYGFSSPYRLRCRIIGPGTGDNLYPYFDATGDMVAFSREYSVIDSGNVKHLYFETYTDEMMYKWECVSGTWQETEGYPRQNMIGKIPIIYARQPLPEWADVEQLIERMEYLLSNFADTNDYHASPKIVVTGQIQRWADKGESGSVIETDEGAKVEYLTWSQAPESIKLELDTLYRMIHTITGTPDISFDSLKGLNVSGVSLKLMFMDAHLKASEKVRDIWNDYLQRRASVVFAFLARMNTSDAAFVEGCRNAIVRPEVRPYMIQDESTKVSMLTQAVAGGVMSRRTAIERLGMAVDIDAEERQIIAEGAAGSLADIFGNQGYE